MKLQEKIISEFPKGEAPCQLINNEGYWKTYAKTWIDVEDEAISACPQSLIFLEWDECLYYLPRFMNWILDDIDGKINPKLRTCIYIFPWIIGNWQQLKDSMDNQKIKLIKDFLLACQKDPNYSLDLEMTGIDPKKI